MGDDLQKNIRIRPFASDRYKTSILQDIPHCLTVLDFGFLRLLVSLAATLNCSVYIAIHIIQN